MKNKLKLGQAAGVVAFAIIIGAVSMSSSSTVDARTSLKENRTVNAGVALGLTEAADATELLTAGATSALTYYGAELTVAQNDSNVVTASAQAHRRQTMLHRSLSRQKRKHRQMKQLRHRLPHRPVVIQILVCRL